MVQGCSIAIIGAGAAGIMTAALLNKNFDITIFDNKSPLVSILPTGGGKCNLSNSEPDFKEFAKNYPRGEKFLYSILSRYSPEHTLEYFKNIGVKTVSLDNGKIFPEKMSSKFVRERLLAQVRECKIEKVAIRQIIKNDSGFILKSSNSKYFFDKVIVAVGGHADFSILNELNLEIVPLKPALTGLCTQMDYNSLSGIVLKNVFNYQTGLSDDLLFTHFGISGPLVFKISSLKARDEFPYLLNFDLVYKKLDDSKRFQQILNDNSKKDIKNILSKYLPQNFVGFFLEKIGVNPVLKGFEINSKIRDLIFDSLKNYQIQVLSPRPDGETVMAGGVDLKQINPKTLECKNIPGIYFVGEVLDIDGFCGGFNLQNCWSGAFAVAESINSIL